MRALKHDGIAVACAASVALSVVTLLLGSAWLLSGASLIPSLALTAMSVLGSGDRRVNRMQIAIGTPKAQAIKP